MLEVFKFPLPPTMNNIIDAARCHGRTNYDVSAKLKRKWTNKICAIALSQDPYQFQHEVWVEFYWIVKNWGRDPDNIYCSSKFIFDGLVEAQVIKNDNLTVIQSPISHFYFKGEDSVIVAISATPITQEKPEQIVNEHINLSVPKTQKWKPRNSKNKPLNKV